MLRYIYTDALPGDDELGDSPMEAVQNLLPRRTGTRWTG
ncbi:hypothetical protein ACP70R_000493 [Stipagrostis hirtigluma subsp. patula]